MDNIASALALAEKGLLSPDSFKKLVSRIVNGKAASSTSGYRRGRSRVRSLSCRFAGQRYFLIGYFLKCARSL